MGAFFILMVLESFPDNYTIGSFFQFRDIQVDNDDHQTNHQ